MDSGGVVLHVISLLQRDVETYVSPPGFLGQKYSALEIHRRPNRKQGCLLTEVLCRAQNHHINDSKSRSVEVTLLI